LSGPEPVPIPVGGPEEATGERIGFLHRRLMALPICPLVFVALAAILLLPVMIDLVLSV
jgi:solute carrier family 13 (sodium-dependent dicarboxylate transporter), member 2/3/5